MITKTQQYLLSKLPAALQKNIVVELSSGCWLWQTNIGGGGYGRVSVTINKKRKRVAAHKHNYKILHGDYDESLSLDHVYCEHKNCCNPTHVSPVTQYVNIGRSGCALVKNSKVIKFTPPPEDNELEELLSNYCYVRK